MYFYFILLLNYELFLLICVFTNLVLIYCHNYGRFTFKGLLFSITCAPGNGDFPRKSILAKTVVYVAAWSAATLGSEATRLVLHTRKEFMSCIM